MRTLVAFLAMPAALAFAQASQPPDQGPPAQGKPLAASAPAPSEPTVEQTASPDLVGHLVKELSITPNQAQGAAGTLFGLAKNKLSAADFAKVAGAVPNMEGLLKAAPAGSGKQSALDLVAGQAGLGGLGAVAGAAGTLSKLGLKPETIAKLAPTLVKAVESKGGAEVASLLQGALK
jgi:hypothetical protein